MNSRVKTVVEEHSMRLRSLHNRIRGAKVDSAIGVSKEKRKTFE